MRVTPELIIANSFSESRFPDCLYTLVEKYGSVINGERVKNLTDAVVALCSKNGAAADRSLGYPSEAQQARASGEQRVLLLWPEYERAFEMCVRFRNQIISVGVVWVVGTNYAAVQPYLDRMAKDDDDWQALFADFQECESAMVERLAEK